MRLDTHGIRFRLFVTYLGLAIGILLFIGLLQIGLIRPYYRNSKIRSITRIADSIQQDLIIEDTESSIEDAVRQTVNNNVCIVMYNEFGNVVYRADALGNGCILNESGLSQLPEFNSFSAISETLENVGSYSTQLENVITQQDMIIYGRKISANLSNYYLLVNGALEPVDSIVSFFMRQYAIYTILAIVISSVVSVIISRQVTRPIVTMKHEAKKLSNGDYRASFEGGKFTETKELAQTLNDANDRLGKIDQIRRDLMANVSHDLRTPLTDIRAYAEMIRDLSGEDPIKRNKHLNVIMKETDYMAQLLNDMSELSKMQSGTYVLHKQNVDLVRKIHDIVELHLPLIQQANLEVKVETPEILTVYADDVKIGQVISNYLSNAIKHSYENKTIIIRGYILKDEETVRLEVIDEGDGIAEEDLPYIWNRYHKSSKSFSRNMTNTGLGLSIVKAIVDLHHGSCGVVSKLNKGSTFWVELKESHVA